MCVNTEHDCKLYDLGVIRSWCNGAAKETVLVCVCVCVCVSLCVCVCVCNRCKHMHMHMHIHIHMCMQPEEARGLFQLSTKKSRLFALRPIKTH